MILWWNYFHFCSLCFNLTGQFSKKFHQFCFSTIFSPILPQTQRLDVVHRNHNQYLSIFLVERIFILLFVFVYFTSDTWWAKTLISATNTDFLNTETLSLIQLSIIILRHILKKMKTKSSQMGHFRRFFTRCLLIAFTPHRQVCSRYWTWNHFFTKL